MKLRIANNFTLPPEAVTETFAILGIRGSGKTNTGVVLTEELLAANQQVVIIDPVDVWWGLKSSKDGKSGGYPLPVIGGDHADVPLDGAAGVVLADFVTDSRASVILSLRHLSMNDQRRFAGDFAKRLYERKGQQRSPLMLMVDEADEFVPQRLPHGHEAMFGAFDRLVRRGRSSGIGVTLISQRAQVINKDVLSQMGTLVGMRVLHKLDRKALEAWIQAHDTENRQEEFMASLASLGRGDAWIWSPSWLGVFERIHVRERHTYDSSATPRQGDKIAAPKELAPVDLDSLRQRMADTIEKAKQDDPKTLRARIAELERDLKKKGTPGTQFVAGPPDRAAIERAAVQGGLQMVKQMGQEFKRVVTPARKAMGDAIVALRTAAARLEEALPPESMNPTAVDLPRPAPQPRPVSTQVKPAQRASRPEASANGNVTGAAQRILDALAELEALGVKHAPRVQVAFMAGYTNLASKGFANAIGALRTGEYIEYPGAGTIALTNYGRQFTGHTQAPRSSEELQDRLISMLGGANGRIVRELVSVYPGSLPREVLAERAGYTNTASKGFANAIGRLRSLGFIDYPERGQIRAQDVLFLEASARGH